MLCLIGILLILQAVVRYNDFVSNEHALMENGVKIGGKEVERLINELHNEVEIFSEEKYEIINFLAAYPDSEEISAHLQKKVAGLFPEYLSISILDENGLTRYNSENSESDRPCMDDVVSLLVSGRRNAISIHEYKSVYHFDVMNKWGKPNISGIFKISFNPGIIARSLQISEATGHQLMLTNKIKSNLIEVTTRGARIQTDHHEGAMLDSDAMARIGASYDVVGTQWRLVALADKNLYRNQLNSILAQTFTVMIAIGIVGIVMIRTMRRAEQRRNKSEFELIAAKEQLQQALDFSDVLLCRWDTQSDDMMWSENAGLLFADNTPRYFSAYLEMLDKPSRDEFQAVVQSCLDTHEAYHHEHRIKIPGGRTCWIEASGNFELNSETGHIEIISLVTEITGRKEAENRRIEVEKMQRDTLVREVHHRIKNHLQGVVGLLRQHTQKNPAMSDVIDMAVGQLHSVSTVYGLQSREQKNHITMNELVAEICKANSGMSGTEIRYTYNDDINNNIVIGEERAVAIALVINELMTNAIKHTGSMCEREIRVDLLLVEGVATITIENSITEIPDGFDFEAGKGLGTGLTLIQSLLPSKGARLSIKSGRDYVRAELVLSSPVVRNEV
jgi:two-component sensor histidine kinase